VCEKSEQMLKASMPHVKIMSNLANQLSCDFGTKDMPLHVPTIDDTR
jgi:hypothetical protein